jgi:hypothetical protein
MRSIASLLVPFVLVAALVTTATQAAGVVYLSDLPFQPAGLTNGNGSYFDGIRVNSHQTITTMTGSQYYSWDRPIQIGGQAYDKAVLFHLVHDETVKATWALNHRFSRLTGIIGLDDTQDMPGIFPHVTVTFIGDHRTLGSASFQSVYGTPNPTPAVDINVAGVNSLTVEVTLTGTGGGTNLDIVNPQLLGGSELATNAVTSSTEQQALLAARRAAAQAQLQLLAAQAQERFLAYKSRFQLAQIDRHVNLLNAALQRVSCNGCQAILKGKIAAAMSLRNNIALTTRPVSDLGLSLIGHMPGDLGELPKNPAHANVPATPNPGLGKPVVCPAPAITSLSASQGGSGDPLTIYGSGFSRHPNIYLIGAAVPEQMSISTSGPAQINTQVPEILNSQAFSGYIAVVNPPCQQGMRPVQSNAWPFQFNPPPQQTPKPTPIPSQVTGAHAGSVGNQIPPSGQPCQVPQITSLSVSAGQPNDPVTITGSGFGHTGEVRFLMPSGSLQLMNSGYWSDGTIIADVPNITGVQAFPTSIYVVGAPCQTGGPAQQSNAWPFQFNPEIDTVMLPISSSDAAWANFGCGIDSCGSSAGTQPGGTAGDTVWAGHVTGVRGDDQFFSGYQLANGWVFDKANLQPEWAVTSNDGCQIGSGPSPGSASLFVDVHCYVSPDSGSAGYLLSIYITGPAGVPYH